MPFLCLMKTALVVVKQEEEREENKGEEQEKKGDDAEIQEKVMNRFSMVQTFKRTQRTTSPLVTHLMCDAKLGPV